MSNPDSALLLRARLAVLRRHRVVMEVVDAFLTAFFYAFFTVACLGLMDRIRLEVLPGGTPYSSGTGLLWGSVLVLAGCAVYGLLAGLRDVPPDAVLARDYDHRFALDDRFASALDFAVRGYGPGLTAREAAFQSALVQDAERATRSFRPGEVYRLRPLGYRWTSLVALLIALWIPFVPIPRPPLPVRPDTLDPDEPPDRHRPPRRPPADPLASPADPAGSEGNPDAKGGGGKGALPVAPAAPAASEDPSQSPPSGGNQGGNNPGKGSPDQLLGDPERNPGNRVRKDVDPLFGQGKAARREVDIYEGDTAAAASGAPAAPLFKNLYQKYQRVAEDTLSRESIPTEERDYVKRYFEEIRPR